MQSAGTEWDGQGGVKSGPFAKTRNLQKIAIKLPTAEK
jgi:hypothetical protein